MGRRFCEACNMMRNGVKTRIALEHTCGLPTGAIPDKRVECESCGWNGMESQLLKPDKHLPKLIIDQLCPNCNEKILY